jgi:hypothetical protein
MCEKDKTDADAAAAEREAMIKALEAATGAMLTGVQGLNDSFDKMSKALCGNMMKEDAEDNADRVKKLDSVTA